MRQITYGIDGTTYYGEVSTIANTHLGWDAHTGSLLTTEIRLSRGGVFTVFGGRALYNRSGIWNTNYGLAYISGVLLTVGVSSWEALIGATVVALYDGSEEWSRNLVGIASVADSDRVMLFDKHYEDWAEEVQG